VQDHCGGRRPLTGVGFGCGDVSSEVFHRMGTKDLTE
jgi:hypothetical protein